MLIVLVVIIIVITMGVFAVVMNMSKEHRDEPWDDYEPLVQNWRAAPVQDQFGQSDLNVHRQRGNGKRTGSGKSYGYTADRYNGDGNGGKRKGASRNEDSWQNFQDLNSVSFTMRNTEKTNTNGIVHNMQIKTDPHDKNPAVGIGQKNGYWAIKTGSNDSVPLKNKNGQRIPATEDIDVHMQTGKNGKFDVMVNGEVVAKNVAVTDETIMKTGIYASDKNLIGKDQTLGLKLKNIKTT